MDSIGLILTFRTYPIGALARGAACGVLLAADQVACGWEGSRFMVPALPIVNSGAVREDPCPAFRRSTRPGDGGLAGWPVFLRFPRSVASAAEMNSVGL